MPEITQDQIEHWKRDSEILSEIDNSLNINDDWGEQVLFMELLDTNNLPHPSDLKYYIWQRKNPSEPKGVRAIDGRQFENPEKDKDGNIIIKDSEGNIVEF